MTSFPSLAQFQTKFESFKKLATALDNTHGFTNFHEGFAAVWESYKPRLRELALSKLGADGWSESSIGSGTILQHTIDAIEIQDNLGDRTNNLVFWQNRFGHANRDHRALLDATLNPKLRKELENLLFGLYRGQADEGATFDRLSDLTGAKYPLVAYLYFLKDMNRFMPIQPTGFDRAFKALAIDFSTLRQCNWENYSTYNAILDDLRPALETIPGLKNIRLIDAHSFCWIFATLLKLDANGSISRASARNNAGRVLSSREISIYEMANSIERTVGNSNGQTVQQTVRNKELRMTRPELEKHIKFLLENQKNCCNLSGIPFHFHGQDADDNLKPSPDRIDSNGHYEVGNLQIVCRFINFWKGSQDNTEFKRLLTLVANPDLE